MIIIKVIRDYHIWTSLERSGVCYLVIQQDSKTMFHRYMQFVRCIYMYKFKY